MKLRKSPIFLIPLFALAACRREEPSTSKAETPAPKQEAPALAPVAPPKPLPSKPKANETSADNNSTASASDPSAGKSTVPEDVPPPVTPKAAFPTAARVPGKPDMVLSPYTNQMIDVSGMTSGSLAKDPTNGRIFRVP